MRVVALIVLVPGLLVWSRELHAEPEWNIAAQTSLCGRGEDGKVWRRTAFCGAFRGDILFGRERNADFAAGPYVVVGSAAFSDLRFGGGLSLLFPTLGG